MNSVSWIFGLLFEYVHKWKSHHWNAQDPRTQCTVLFHWIDRFANILKTYNQTIFNVQSFFFFFSSSSWNHRRASLMGHKISVGLIYHLGSTCPWISKKRKIPWLFKMTPNFLSLISKSLLKTGNLKINYLTEIYKKRVSHFELHFLN